MSFSNFSILEQDIGLIRFHIEMSFGIFNVSTETEIYMPYLQCFSDELKNLYDHFTEKQKAVFSPIERDVDILFETGENTGYISALINLYYDSICENNATLTCKYTIDQSFLPELIEEIETTLEELR
jgi:hypothetical protein